ncbi:MAG: alanine--tRNA ligase, partial [Eubacteriales bacterium]
MQWTSLNDLREKYLSFFESKGHLRLPSFPLVPINDKSLLLINSGMAPMKKYFTGEEEPPRRRVTTCQKCIRTPDLERVGHTARHGTYFEMLGNFSFGDYFKNEAIPWAWEFLTECLEIPADKLWPSIYENDDEAFEIWNKKVGVPAERIVRLGKEDNFWEHGSGPCGPCSEIYFDRGEKYGCGSPDCKPGCDCDRYMEIWNNVFSQFNNDGNGNYTELAQKNIDTGMGLERLACVMQGVDNLFEVDTVRKILNTVCDIAGKQYGENDKDDISIRVITDHIRSATFMICDGVIPSNEGRGYVLRRILRRACRHAKLLGINHEFLGDLCDVVIGENEGAYPELREKRDYIRKVISMEETRFDATIDAGLSILSNLIRGALAEHADVISGEEVFKLYDTFGFPIDLTREIASENHLNIDENKFASLMRAQKKRAREARVNIGGWDESSKSLLSGLPKTEFTGYTD